MKQSEIKTRFSALRNELISVIKEHGIAHRNFVKDQQDFLVEKAAAIKLVKEFDPSVFSRRLLALEDSLSELKMESQRIEGIVEGISGSMPRSNAVINSKLRLEELNKRIKAIEASNSKTLFWKFWA